MRQIFYPGRCLLLQIIRSRYSTFYSGYHGAAEVKLNDYVSYLNMDEDTNQIIKRIKRFKPTNRKLYYIKVTYYIKLRCHPAIP